MSLALNRRSGWVSLPILLLMMVVTLLWWQQHNDAVDSLVWQHADQSARDFQFESRLVKQWLANPSRATPSPCMSLCAINQADLILLNDAVSGDWFYHYESWLPAPGDVALRFCLGRTRSEVTCYWQQGSRSKANLTVGH